MDSIFWHDYETFGADTRRDRPSQFAGVRTDLDLNIIDEPVTFYCKPAEDFLPSPDACLITGITPQLAYSEGLVEAEFAREIQTLFSVPHTCVAGYNSIRFDDEISRNLFYRNFYDPYEREWRNGNSRWDIIDLVRLTYALRPDGINWPMDEHGVPSFRLEKLTKANDIEHEAAHDAMSDVYATIAVARLIKQKQPQLYNFVFQHRHKASLLSFFEGPDIKPLFHVSSKYPASAGCCALVLPLFKHPHNANGYVVFDLRQNPESLYELSIDEISTRLYTTTSELQESGKFRPAIKTIHINKCPMVAPASVVKTIPDDRLLAWNLDIPLMMQHLAWIRANPEFSAKIYSVFSQKRDYPPETDPDLMIYSGFFGTVDKQLMSEIRQASSNDLADKEFPFVDERLHELLFRYKARNFPVILNDEELDQWQRYCAHKLFDKQSGYLTFETYFSRIQVLASAPDIKPRDLSILEDLKYYAESIIPYNPE